jgi:hypothetical protein
MNKETSVKFFEKKLVRSHWNEEKEKWYSSNKTCNLTVEK